MLPRESMNRKRTSRELYSRKEMRYFIKASKDHAAEEGTNEI